MKLLLTSAGIKNASILNALLELLGKPIAECHALCIPTAGYGHPMGTPGGAWRFAAGEEPRTPMSELGWKSRGLLELTALPSIGQARWESWVRQADVFARERRRAHVSALLLASACARPNPSEWSGRP